MPRESRPFDSKMCNRRQMKRLPRNVSPRVKFRTELEWGSFIQTLRKSQRNFIADNENQNDYVTFTKRLDI